MESTKLKIYGGRVLTVALVVFIWELLTGGIVQSLRLLDPLIFSRPSLILQDLLIYVPSDKFLKDLTSTLQATFYGLALSIVVGLALGLAMGASRVLYGIFSPFIAALNTLPRPAIAPLFVIWFGFGLLTKTMISFFTAFFVIFYNVLEGYRNIDKDIYNTVLIMGGRRIHLFKYVIVPSVATWVFASLKVAIAFALIGAVLGEFVGALEGLGRELIVASGIFNTARVYAILFILMAIGVSLVSITEQIERRLLKWRGT